jgi:hypothetical protein
MMLPALTTHPATRVMETDFCELKVLSGQDSYRIVYLTVKRHRMISTDRRPASQRGRGRRPVSA